MQKQIILGLSLLVSGMLQAQESQQYLHFNMGGGLNNLSYQLLDGTQKGQAGFTFNAAYSYFLNPNWGLQTGIGLQSFGALGTVNLLTKESKIDQDGDSYELRTNYDNWQEKQNTLFLEIPLVGQYRYTLNQKFKLLASAGVKVGIPINTSYKTTGGTIETTGYYNQWNIELNDLPDHGFSAISTSYKGNYLMITTGMAIADIGALYKITEKADLYLGAYFNYGLTNVLTPDNQLIYQQDGKYNGIFTSNQTNSITPLSLGLKIGIYWQLDKTK